jgi:hypothetical protein
LSYILGSPSRKMLSSDE